MSQDFSLALALQTIAADSLRGKKNPKPSTDLDINPGILSRHNTTVRLELEFSATLILGELLLDDYCVFSPQEFFITLETE